MGRQTFRKRRMRWERRRYCKFRSIGNKVYGLLAANKI